MEELFWRKKGGGREEKTKEKIQMKPKLQSYREKKKGRKEKKQKFEDEVFLNARDLVS